MLPHHASTGNILIHKEPHPFFIRSLCRNRQPYIVSSGPVDLAAEPVLNVVMVAWCASLRYPISAIAEAMMFAVLLRVVQTRSRS